MPELRPLDLSDAGLTQVSAFLLRMFPKARHLTRSYLAWDYVENPDGAALGRNAFVGDALVGHVAGQRLRALVHGREQSGILVHNVATDPGRRRDGLFTRLMHAMLDDARAQGLDFAVAIANASSTPAFLHKLGFQLVCPLDARVGIGSAPAPVREVSVQFQRLWSADALAWRVRAPGRRYGMRGDTLMASGAAPGVAAALAELGSEAPRLPPAARAPLRLWIGIDPRRDWSRSGYLDVPRRLRPSPLNLVFRALDAESATLDADRVRIDVLDFDAY